MQVTAAETVPYALPFASLTRPPADELDRREMVLLRLRTDDGPDGLGEAVPLSLRGGSSLADVQEAVEESAARLVGLDLDASDADPLGFAVATMLELTAPRRIASAAAAALECALFDLVAKAAGLPLWQAPGRRGRRAGAHATRRLRPASPMRLPRRPWTGPRRASRPSS